MESIPQILLLHFNVKLSNPKGNAKSDTKVQQKRHWEYMEIQTKIPTSFSITKLVTKAF